MCLTKLYEALSNIREYTVDKFISQEKITQRKPHNPLTSDSLIRNKTIRWHEELIALFKNQSLDFSDLTKLQTPKLKHFILNLTDYGTNRFYIVWLLVFQFDPQTPVWRGKPIYFLFDWIFVTILYVSPSVACTNIFISDSKTFFVF